MQFRKENVFIFLRMGHTTHPKTPPYWGGETPPFSTPCPTRETPPLSMPHPLVAFGYCATHLLHLTTTLSRKETEIFDTLNQYPFTVSGDIFRSTTGEHSPMLPPDTRLSISNSAILFKKLHHHSLFTQHVLKDATRGHRTISESFVD